MPVLSSQDQHPRPRSGDDEPSWAEKVADILRRIFVPERQPEPVLVPVYVPQPRIRRRG
jgi:hypothetical protein